MASDTHPNAPPPCVDMSPEAIAARIRRVVELNRLCCSLAAAVPVPVAQGTQREDGLPAPDTLTAR